MVYNFKKKGKIYQLSLFESKKIYLPYQDKIKNVDPHQIEIIPWSVFSNKDYADTTLVIHNLNLDKGAWDFAYDEIALALFLKGKFKKGKISTSPEHDIKEESIDCISSNEFKFRINEYFQKYGQRISLLDNLGIFLPSIISYSNLPQKIKNSIEGIFF